MARNVIDAVRCEFGIVVGFSVNPVVPLLFLLEIIVGKHLKIDVRLPCSDFGRYTKSYRMPILAFIFFRQKSYQILGIPKKEFKKERNEKSVSNKFINSVDLLTLIGTLKGTKLQYDRFI